MSAAPSPLAFLRLRVSWAGHHWQELSTMSFYKGLPVHTSSSSQARFRLPNSPTVAKPPQSSDEPFSPITTSPKPRKTRRHSHSGPSFFFRPRRTLYVICRFVLPALLALVLFCWWLYEPHIELAFYNRKWVTEEVEALTPLSGCFNPGRVSGMYNLTESLYGRKSTEVQAGMSLRMGMDCYDFAGTLQTAPRVTDFIPGDQRTQFHTYWRNDLAQFSTRQEWLLKSFFATQNLATSRLVLWSNGDLSSNPLLRWYSQKYPHAFALAIVNIPMLARGTSLEGSERLRIKDERAWVDGDLIRLLLLWQHGGVWIDMDSLLTRSLEPLLEHEFVTQWDCYGQFRYFHSRDKGISPSFRQNILSDEWRAHAFPPTLPVPLRGFPHHQYLPPSTLRLDRLGCTSLPQTLAAVSRRGHPTFQNSTLLFQRWTIMSSR